METFLLKPTFLGRGKLKLSTHIRGQFECWFFEYSREISSFLVNTITK